MAENKGDEKIGHVVEVIGPVVDILFQEHHLPFIHHAVRITSEGFDVPEPLDIVAEVEQQLGEGRVRCVAMKPTEGSGAGNEAGNRGGADFGAGRACYVGTRAERVGRAGGQTWSSENGQAV